MSQADYSNYTDSLDREPTPWMPQKEPLQPRQIIGRVLDRYETLSAFKNGDGEDIVPVLVIDDEKNGVEWTVKGYATMLRGQILRANPQVGDLAGAAYYGQPDPKDPQSPHRTKFRVFERANGEVVERESPTLDAHTASGSEADSASDVDEQRDDSEPEDDGIPFDGAA
jgi:hypothetical protein